MVALRPNGEVSDVSMPTLTGVTRGSCRIERDFAQKIVYVEDACKAVLDAIAKLENCADLSRISVGYFVSISFCHSKPCIDSSRPLTIGAYSSAGSAVSGGASSSYFTHMSRARWLRLYEAGQV